MKKRDRPVCLWYSVFDNSAICFNKNVKNRVYEFVRYSNWYLVSNLVRGNISNHVNNCVSRSIDSNVYYFLILKQNEK